MVNSDTPSDTSEETDITYINAPSDDEEELLQLQEEMEEESCEDGRYYLGSYKHITAYQQLLMMTRISLRTFHAGNYNSLQNYIFWFSGSFIPDPRLHIIQVHLQDGCTTAVLKTFWIRLIQRTWRRIMKERREYMERKKREILAFIGKRELGIKDTYPEWRGMLARV
jgi:hypothetical protein